MSKTFESPEAGDSDIVIGGSSFPANWRDIAGWRADGVSFSSPSNEAVKLYDALLHQAIYHYHDPMLGGFTGTSKSMLAADPDFAMGNIFTLGMDCFATSPLKNAEPRKKLIDFSAKAKLNCKLPSDEGETKRLKDIPSSIVEHYTPSTPFYGHVFGKLCFGQGENCEYEAGEISGRKALDHFPLDNWAHHALAHNFEESGRALQGRLFLSNTARDWTQGTTFSHHIWWHTALFHVQLGEFDAALDLYDARIGPMTLKDGGNFPLSDGSSLLMRLHLEGVNIGERAREQATAWTNHNDDFVSLFYDGHNAFMSLLAGDRMACTTLINNMQEYIKGDRQGWNKDVTARVGVPLVEGITQYMDGEYSSAVQTLAPIMSELQGSIQGSRAQKDIYAQILLHAAARSGVSSDLNLAEEILTNKLKESKLEKHTPLNQRFYERMIAVHQH